MGENCTTGDEVVMVAPCMPASRCRCRESAAPGKTTASPAISKALASRCFGYVKDWVERKVGRHLMQRRGRPGFGWQRWSGAVGLCAVFVYRVIRQLDAIDWAPAAIPWDVGLSDNRNLVGRIQNPCAQHEVGADVPNRALDQGCIHASSTPKIPHWHGSPTCVRR